MAALHADADHLTARFDAHKAMLDSYDADTTKMRELGYGVDTEQLAERQHRLGAILDHYAATTDPLLGLCRMEEEINVPIPARESSRSSSRYRYHAFIDGHFEDDHPWIAEFKLRKTLTPVELIVKMPQFRWYAWARRQELRWRGPVGVLIDERLNEAPKPARVIKAKRKGEGVDGKVASQAVDQLTTPESYERACEETATLIDIGVLRALRERRWHQRVPLVFTPAELDEAGQELVSAAQVIRDLDAGRLYPVRNGSRQNCQGCRYKAICGEPQDEFTVGALFDRQPPKRERGREGGHVAA